jgi:drug/metabolite transporter (DMT)-like permease
MAAVLCGLLAALVWSAGTVFSSQASRVAGPRLTLAWVMLIGLEAIIVLIPLSGSLHISASAVLWLVLNGTGSVVGLLLLYRALEIGRLGVVMPIVSIEGGIAAALAMIAGEPVGLARVVAMAITVVGVVLSATTKTDTAQTVDRRSGQAIGEWVRHPGSHLPSGVADRRAACWAVPAAVALGVGLFATGRSGQLLPPAWAVLPPRLIGVVVLTLPLAGSGRLGLPPGAVRLVLIAGLCEVGGFLAYAEAARHDIAVAGVLASLAGTLAAGFGRIFFAERLATTQVVGLLLIFIGVGTIAALSG